MTTILTPSDVAALVSTFSPPIPTKDQPSLVRSASGNCLVSSESILSRFNDLLKTSRSREKLSELKVVLDVETAEWILECHDGFVHVSRDGRSIISETEVEKIREELHSRAEKEFVMLHNFATIKDISSTSLDHLAKDLRIMQCEPATVYAGSWSLVTETQDRVDSLIAESAVEQVDLTTALPSIPQSVLVEFANSSSRIGGNTAEVVNGSVLVSPAGYEALQAKRKQAARKARIDKLLVALKSGGFVAIENNDTSIAEGVASRYSTEHSEDVERHLEGDILYIVTMNQLHQTLHDMKNALLQLADSPAAHEDNTLDESIQARLIQESSNKAVAEMLLRTKYKRQIQHAFSEVTEERNRAQLEMMVRDNLTSSLYLYVRGLAAIQDPALAQRLDTYILEYCKKEILPHFSDVLRHKGLVQADKSLAKELDKLQKAVEPAQRLADVEAAMTKFAKKCKITPSNPADLAKAKKDILKQKLQSMSNMERASDILQNTIWILLAEKHDGLFMSSGKDTSRMIKQYQLVGDEQIVKQAEQWRDSLKKGAESEELVKEMRHLASKTVHSLCAEGD